MVRLPLRHRGHRVSLRERLQQGTQHDAAMGRPLAEVHVVHVVVAGGPATGKTMLIHAAGGKDVAGPSVAAPLRIPGASLPDKVDALLIDTSSALVRTPSLAPCLTTLPSPRRFQAWVRVLRPTRNLLV